LRIREWDERYEVNDKKGSWSEGQKLRKSRLLYVRSPAKGLTTDEEWHNLRLMAGDEIFAVFGLFRKLTEVAGCHESGHRGFALTSDYKVIGAHLIVRYMGGNVESVKRWLGWLLCDEVKWIEACECDFAVEMEHPLSGVDIPQMDYSWDSRNSRNSGNLNNETEVKDNLNKTKTKEEQPAQTLDRGEKSEIHEFSECVNSGGSRRGHAESGGSADLDVSGGSAAPGPGCSGSEVRCSGDSGSENFEDSDSGDSDSDVRAGTRGGRGQQAAFLLASQSSLKWEFDLAWMNVKRESPRCILQNLSNDKFNAKLAVMDRAMKWFKELLPQLEPSTTARDDVQKQARSDITTIHNRMDEAWKCGGDPAVVDLVMIMQQKVIAVEKSRGRLHNVMALWGKEVKKYLIEAKQRNP